MSCAFLYSILSNLDKRRKKSVQRLCTDVIDLARAFICEAERDNDNVGMADCSCSIAVVDDSLECDVHRMYGSDDAF